MTEKTDIEALRDLAERIKAAMASCVESFCMEVSDSIENEIGRELTEQEHQQISETASGLLVAQDQLEAERQRADELEALALAMRDDMRLAREELAELRGEQDHGDTMVYMMPNVFASLVNTARDVALEYKNAQCLRDALSRELKGYFTFTSQPKPVVVLPKLTVCEVMHRSGFDRQYAEGWVSANDWAINELKIAGIVVKDGE